MTSIKVGIVAEGPSDLVVIRKLFGEYFKESGVPGVDLEFSNLQPYIDNTSKSGYSEGGWLMVYKWCLAHSPELRKSTYFDKGIFAEDMDAFQVSGIIVHMDADICSELKEVGAVDDCPTDACAPEKRGEYIRLVLQSWLWPNGEEVDKQHILCPAVESTEAWLVSGLSDELNPESLPDIQRILAQLDYAVVKGKKPPEKIKKPNKKAENYETISEIASIQVSRIAERCQHFKSAANELVDLVRAQTLA